MRLFAAINPHNSAPRTAVPAEILRRLASGRPERRAIQPAAPVQVVQMAESLPAPQRTDALDLDQRVRESGEW